MSDCRVPMSSYKPIRPSSVFGDCEIALETVCERCPDEHGWAFGDPDTPSCCVGMIEIMDDEFGSIVAQDGRYACVRRLNNA